MRKTISVKRNKEFLAKYNLERRLLLRPDRAKGKPGISAGYSEDGTEVIVKVWPRSSAVEDRDLEDIWRNELRQLQRLSGSPHAAKFIPNLYDAGEDSFGFYLVLAPGSRRPLKAVIDGSSGNHWSRQQKNPESRYAIWENMRLLASGLEVLHRQGLIHRNIDHWAVLTTGENEADFQLTGFEWSMRIVSSETSSRSKFDVDGPRNSDSFLRDWKQFGHLATDLLGVNTKRLETRSLISSDVADGIPAGEIILLRELTQVYPTHYIDGETVAQKITVILENIESTLAKREWPYVLALRLGQDSPVSARIRECSKYFVEIDDIESQLTFIKNDIAEQPLLIALKGIAGERLVLRGQNLLYKLRQYKQPGTTKPSWDFAFCEDVEKQDPTENSISSQLTLPSSSVNCISHVDAKSMFPTKRGKLRPWSMLQSKLAGQSPIISPEITIQKALTLIQLVETLYAAADVFAVDVESPPEHIGAESTEQIVVKIRDDKLRNELSTLLNLRSPIVRFREALTGESRRPEGWTLTDSKTLGERNPTDTEWEFLKPIEDDQQESRYIFTGTKPPFVQGNLFLVPREFSGSGTQFKRRIRALRALKDHTELQRMLVDARARILDSHEKFTEDAGYLSLDPSKQKALEQITTTLPLYLVQGPPGVGKTRLVSELVKRRLTDDHTARLLLSAQSNAAVDHLMDELDSVLNNETVSPLIIRSHSRDQAPSSSKYNVRAQTSLYVDRLAASNLVRELPSPLVARLKALASTLKNQNSTSQQALSQDKRLAQEIRSIEGLLVRSANVVFATSNSYELERAIEERSQFDWSIIEEAGKATGSELVASLLLSHRRLMIGDHKQLPPFSADKVEALLSNPERIHKLLEMCKQLLSKSFRDSTFDEILEEIERNEDNSLSILCSEAIRVLFFFESTIEAEFKRQKNLGKGRPIASPLTEQHRMHPGIAELISECFYGGDLKTFSSAKKRYLEGEAPFTYSKPAVIPLTPIVIIDAPYVQSAIKLQVGEQPPRWTNNNEAKIVSKLLGLATARTDSSPTLAVLSPYSQQCERLGQSLHKVIDERGHIGGFSPPGHAGQFVHTVDSFQGNEADLVIISLVRNNQHSTLRNALGFLCDERRMNVLLSRARWQMIIVTSLQFLTTVIDSPGATSFGDDISFMRTFLNFIRNNKESVAIVPASKLFKL